MTRGDKGQGRRGVEKRREDATHSTPLNVAGRLASAGWPLRPHL